ncbi:MAG: carbon-monoxide dehydrogenase catalytic subunit [Planctomycetes bacterium RBG_16_64_12]|nr:MAG: carbon-monoxide dehydrogenase catalytic subunit [Planctomycetes bacterium RBG_16_64_12]
MADKRNRSVDPATLAMIDVATARNMTTPWDRLESQQPQCGFGTMGICCRNCFMGPCRIDPFGEGAQEGICGADADTIVARNLLRHICTGTSAHSDHSRDVVHALALAAEGKSEAYRVRGARKLSKLAEEYGIATDGRSVNEVAKEVAQFLLKEFGKQEGVLANVGRAPEQQRKNWAAAGAVPRGIDREVVTGLHMTHVGADNDAEHVIMGSVRAALADGWGGSMIATDVSDVLFGEPHPLRSRVNLGVIKEDEVNIIVHGHEPTLSDVVVAATRDPQLLALAKEKGAKGINLAGICCTANEILMRHGIPIAGNFLQQELAVMTGAVDVMLVDIQCVFPALVQMQKCFHTKVVSTSAKAKFPGSTYVEFHEEKAMETAKQIVRLAIENYPNRDPDLINIPKQQEPLVAGFTTEVVSEILGGRYRPSYRPLNDGIQTGRLRGVAGVVGCNNPKFPHDESHLAMVKELIRNDVLVVQTGCSAIACGKGGLLAPEAAERFAGKGLQEICRAVGIPPVLHTGSCVDNSRILTACAEMVREGGIGDSFDKLPVAGAAPEWMSEKAIAIGMYFVASGIFVVIGQSLPVQGSRRVVDLLTKDFEKHFGATWAFEPDAIKAAHLMIDRIDRKRADLGLPTPMYQVPYKPKTADSAPKAHAGAKREPVAVAAGSCPGPATAGIEDT